MTSPELGIATEDNTAMAGHVAVPPQAGVVMSTGGLDDAVERAFEAAVREAARLGDLLDALATGRLWVPVTLGSSGRRALAEGAVRLPTVRYLGDTFVPAYTSATRLLRATEDLAPGDRATVIPHAVVRAADLARRLPPDLGIALNPGGSESVPIYRAGVAHLAAERPSWARAGSAWARSGCRCRASCWDWSGRDWAASARYARQRRPGWPWTGVARAWSSR